VKYAAASLGLILVAGRATAQTGENRLRDQVDGATYASLRGVFDSATAVGLPTGPLVDKALEGAAKHANGDRIVDVVRDLSARLAVARTALGGFGTPDELSAGAAAMRAGIAPVTLAELRRLRHNEQVTIPLAVAAELVARGIRPDSASAEVLRLAAAGAPDVELAALPHSLAAPSVASSVAQGGTGYGTNVPAANEQGKTGAPTEAGSTKRRPQRP
jgi:hypothetical protein